MTPRWARAGGDDPRPIRESLEALARDLGGPSVVPLAALVARWSEIAGDAVAAHARPLTLRDGVLVVAVDQPIWRTQLGFLEADVRRRVREVTGIEITELRVRVRSN